MHKIYTSKVNNYLDYFKKSDYCPVMDNVYPQTERFSVTNNTVPLLTSLVNSRLYCVQAAVITGIICCVASLDGYTCRLKLLNQDSSCRLQNLSTESELPNAYVCVQN
jgi:hypothetical protein